MPFDSTPQLDVSTVIARLELLQEIAAKTEGCQGSFRTCLWSEVRKRNDLVCAANGTLDSFAFKRMPEPEWAPPKNGIFAAEWFGMGEYGIFGEARIDIKRAWIAHRLAELRADLR